MGDSRSCEPLGGEARTDAIAAAPSGPTVAARRTLLDRLPLAPEWPTPRDETKTNYFARARWQRRFGVASWVYRHVIAAALSARDDALLVATFDRVMERCTSASGPPGDPANLLTLLLQDHKNASAPPVHDTYFRIGVAALRLGRADVTKKLAEHLAPNRADGVTVAAPARARAHHLEFLLTQKTRPAAARRSAEYADRAYRETEELPPDDLLAALAEATPVPAAAGERETPQRVHRAKREVSGRHDDWVYGLHAMQKYLADQDVPVRRDVLQHALKAGDILGARREKQGKKAWCVPRRVVLDWARARHSDSGAHRKQ